jgi:chromosome segregation ATPase
MKIKIGIVILAAVCVGLLIALLATKKAADDQQAKDTDTINDFSNKLSKAGATIDELNQDNLFVSNELTTTHETLDTLSNNLTSSLLDTSNKLTQTEASLQNAQDQVTNLDSRVADLEAQNRTLDERAATLTNTIAMLDAQITETQQKLAVSDTNNAFLTAQLQTQLELKAELQNKFDNLDTVRAQVKKLRDEAFVARRLQWISSGNNSSGTPQKGAELLMHPVNQSANSATNRPPHYDLNVEVGSDGSVHVIPPATNSPPQQ